MMQVYLSLSQASDLSAYPILRAFLNFTAIVFAFFPNYFGLVNSLNNFYCLLFILIFIEALFTE